MENLNENEVERAYNTAILLNKAILEIANPELIKQLSNARRINQPNFSSNSILETLSAGIQAFQNINSSQLAQKGIIEELKKDIIAQIQKGELIALGIEIPLRTNSKPIQIPAHLFSGEISWENSELKNKNLEFFGIRLLKTETLPKRAFENSESAINSDSVEFKKIAIADLDPDLYIDENKVAAILDMSPRTLQGYRKKGRGPQYNKIGSAVRYRVGDIIEWVSTLKRRNTSQ